MIGMIIFITAILLIGSLIVLFLGLNKLLQDAPTQFEMEEPEPVEPEVLVKPALPRMKKWYISKSDLLLSPTPVREGFVEDLVRATNRRYKITEDAENNNIIVRSVDKPFDSPAHNIFWKRVKRK